MNASAKIMATTSKRLRKIDSIDEGFVMFEGWRPKPPR